MPDTIQLGLESFFDSLVGSEERTLEYTGRLSEEFDRLTEYEDPYVKLFAAGKNIIAQTIEDLVKRDEYADLSPAGKVRLADSLDANAVTGVGITICGLRAVGDTYRRESTSPQPRHKVELNLGRVTRHLYAIAFLGNSNAKRHLKAFYLGVSPLSHKAQVNYGPIEGILDRASTKLVSPDSLIVNSDSKGAIDIRVKHPRYPVEGVNPCPATEVVVNHEGRNKSGLLLMMGSIAVVGIERIYPDIIEITE